MNFFLMHLQVLSWFHSGKEMHFKTFSVFIYKLILIICIKRQLESIKKEIKKHNSSLHNKQVFKCIYKKKTKNINVLYFYAAT